MFRALFLVSVAVALLFNCVIVQAQNGPTPDHAKRLQQPPNLPDVPAYPNISKYVACMGFTSNPNAPGYTVTFLTTDEPGIVMQWYAESLKQWGWTRGARDAVARVISVRKKRALVTVSATASPDKKYKSSVYINYRSFGT